MVMSVFSICMLIYTKPNRSSILERSQDRVTIVRVLKLIGRSIQICLSLKDNHILDNSHVKTYYELFSDRRNSEVLILASFKFSTEDMDMTSHCTATVLRHISETDSDQVYIKSVHY